MMARGDERASRGGGLLRRLGVAVVSVVVGVVEWRLGVAEELVVGGVVE